MKKPTKYQAYAARKQSKLEPVDEIFSQHPFFSKRPIISIYRLQKHWPALVGEMMAKRSQPVRVQKDCLIIAVENQAWGQQFGMMKPVLLQAIVEKLSLHYRDIRFVSEPFEKIAAVHADKPKKTVNKNRSLQEILQSISKLVNKQPSDKD